MADRRTQTGTRNESGGQNAEEENEKVIHRGRSSTIHLSPLNEQEMADIEGGWSGTDHVTSGPSAFTDSESDLSPIPAEQPADTHTARTGTANGSAILFGAAVKAPSDPSDPELVARLGNEYNVLNRIQKLKAEREKEEQEQERERSNNTPTSRSAIRFVLARLPPRGPIQSLRMEYVGGISLKEWIRAHNNPSSTRGEPVVAQQLLQQGWGEGQQEEQAIRNTGKRTDASSATTTAAAFRRAMLDRVHVARGICAAVSEVHEYGVIHNGIGPSSFVVDLVRTDKTTKHHQTKRVSNLSGESIDDNGRGDTNSNGRTNSGEDGVWCSVKIISFGHAAFDANLESDDMGNRANYDMPALGSVIRSLFAQAGVRDDDKCDDGLSDSDSDEDGGLGFGEYDLSGGLSQNQRNSKLPPLLPNLPRSIHALLRSLYDSHNTTTMDTVEHPYLSASEVLQDMDQMIEDPDLFLFDRNEEKEQWDQLRFSPTKLYGHSRQASELRNVCYRYLEASYSTAGGSIGGGGSGSQGARFSDEMPTFSTSSSSFSTAYSLRGSTEIVLVAGGSGVGKSELVRGVVRPWLEGHTGKRTTAEGGEIDDKVGCGGYLIEGRFDRHKTQPYSAIVDALAGLCKDILARGQKEIDRMSTLIREAVGTLGGVITDIVPALVNIIGPQPSVSGEVAGAEAVNRFHYVVRKFFRAINQPGKPVVLFLGDLEWADVASLTLIRAIVAGTDSFIIGSYRPSKVNAAASASQPLADLMAEMESLGVPVTKISMGSINVDAVNCVISDASGMYRRVTRSLAELVHLKSNGKYLFIVQILRTFREEGMLTYDAKAHSWKWDEDRIRECDIPDDLVELFCAKIQTLPPAAQDLMKMASSIRPSFDESTLLAIIDVMLKDHPGRERKLAITTESLRPNIEYLEKEGLIMKTSAAGARRYKFSHDQVQRAAYSLLKEADISWLHTQIGYMLYENAKATDKVDQQLFTIVDHMNLGISGIKTTDERIRLAMLNLQAGEKAMKSSAFATAVVYLKNGLGMLEEDERFAPDTYKITLKLFSAIAEAEVVNCNFDEVDLASQQVFDRALSFLDKFPCYMSLVKSFVTQGKIADAISTGFYVLSQLGEPMPKTAGMMMIARDLMITKSMLRGKTDVKICNLPAMNDETKVAAMRMLSIMVSCCFYVKPEYIAPVTFRMVRLTLRFGLSNESPFGFATYGMILCGILGDTKGGYRFGQLSLSLLEKCDAKEWLARVYGLVFYFIVFWRDPAKATLENFLYASKVAMEVGDHEYAALQFVNYAGMGFQSGQPLQPLQESMSDFNKVCTELGQGVPQSILVLWWQCVLNLMGQSNDPLVLTGSAMNEAKYLEDAAAMGNSVGTHTLYFLRLLLAYTFGQYELANNYAKKSRDVIAKVTPGMLMVATHVFYDGLTACALARECKLRSESKKHTKIALASKKKLKRWAGSSPSTFSHKYSLLRAECAAVKGNKRKASEAYDESMAAARKEGFTQDEALANERAALFHSREGSQGQQTALQHESNAYQLYEEWGAKAKVELLIEQHKRADSSTKT